MNAPIIGIFGEVLFDHFPDGSRVLGGAPFNVAWHLQAFGQQPLFISRVGQDAEGEEVRRLMRDWGMDSRALQSDDQRPTGKVDIQFVDGEPHYDIQRDCAYDAIDPDSAPGHLDFLYHGSLAVRDQHSAGALASIMADRPGTVFVDVNLRPPWWRIEAIRDMLQAADWVKLNQDELSRIYDGALPDDDLAGRCVGEFGLQGLILTRGAAGATVDTADRRHVSISPRASTSVVDTVGAGDAFASVMILGLVNGWDLQTTLQRAQEFASTTVGHRGALIHERRIYAEFLQSWGLEH